MDLLRAVSYVGVAYLICGCATYETTPTEIYNPRSATNPTAPQSMNAVEARRTITEQLQKNLTVSGGWILSDLVTGPNQVSLKWLPVPQNLAQPESHVYTFGSPEGLTVVAVGENFYQAQHNGEFFCSWNTQESAVRFVDAVMSLEKYFTTDHTPETEAELAQFKPVAESYRAKKSKPAIPEDTRKFQIQAENAFDEKRYDDAVRYYQKGLEISPWWPDGHYNLALILGQQGFLPDADKEMKKYLALAPDAPDARKARDKMYIWEGKLELLVHSAPSAPAAQPPAPAPVPEK